MYIYLNPKHLAIKFGLTKCVDFIPRKSLSIFAAMLGVASLSACQNALDSVGNAAKKKIPSSLIHKMKARDMKPSSPIMLRIFKTENIIEIWKQKVNGRYAILETYEICKWSGKLGPKFKEGDRQAPEGFYNVNRHQMNPNSSYHLSFNIGFPNTFDRSNKRTGTHLMVHGACSSAGCYSMTDERVEEIYALAREAFKGGQKKFQVQAYPFRLTPNNMVKHVSHPQFDFWKVLKEGYDHFEITKRPVKVDVCEKRYLFNRTAVDGAKFSSSLACPKVTMHSGLLSAYSERRDAHEVLFSKVLNQKLERSKRAGEVLSLVQEKMTLVAKGYEELPPATPKPVVVEQAVEAKPNVDAVVSNLPVVTNQDETAKVAAPIIGELLGRAATNTSEQFVKLPDVTRIPIPIPAEPNQVSQKIQN